MRLLLISFEALVRLARTLWLLLAVPAALAGSISFSVAFTTDGISITNAGSEAGYRLSLWTLDQASRWRQMQIISGNSDYLAPGQTLKARRLAVVAGAGLGRGDPLLLELHDQAGGQVTQLAWRVAPPLSKNPLPTQRKDGKLLITAGNSSVISTYGIVVPYEGIAQLGHGFAPGSPPPDPQRHIWASAGPLMLDTGAGKGGAWLVHESAAGEIEMQVVADGFDRGKEQIPSWLIWVRNNLMRWAAALAVLGALLVVLGGLSHRRRFGRGFRSGA